jgi:hypothetical protein
VEEPDIRDIVRSSLGDCHLVDAVDHLSWPKAHGEPLFEDDDLGVYQAPCACGRIFLRIWRRVPRDVWHVLVPASDVEVETLRSRLAAAPSSYTDQWSAAESGVLTVTRAHPYLEYSGRPPRILRWCPPGEPFAFGFAP